MKSFYSSIILSLLFSVSVDAQLDLPRQSPKASVSLTVGYTQVSIEYGSPAVRERKIWGELVPFGQVWRMGANEATTIQFTTDATVEGQKVPAGKYSLFAVPGEKEWTLILNKTSKQWGSFNYKKENDLLRFNVIPVKGSFYERLSFSFSDITDNSAAVVLNWEYLAISFKVEVDLLHQTYSKIKDAIAAKPDDWHVYAQGANYAAENGLYLEEAVQWIDKAISLEAGYVPYFLKAKILYKEKKYTEALQALEKCRDIGHTDKNWDSIISQIDFLEKQIKSASR
jgi:Protein of unknown function (DUF2911)